MERFHYTLTTAQIYSHHFIQNTRLTQTYSFNHDTHTQKKKCHCKYWNGKCRKMVKRFSKFVCSPSRGHKPQALEEAINQARLLAQQLSFNWSKHLLATTATLYNQDRRPPMLSSKIGDQGEADYTQFNLSHLHWLHVWEV